MVTNRGQALLVVPALLAVGLGMRVISLLLTLLICKMEWKCYHTGLLL